MLLQRQVVYKQHIPSAWHFVPPTILLILLYHLSPLLSIGFTKFHSPTPSVIPTSRVLSLLTRLASHAVHLRDLRRAVSEQVRDLLRRETEERSVGLLDAVYKFRSECVPETTVPPPYIPTPQSSPPKNPAHPASDRKSVHSGVPGFHFTCSPLQGSQGSQPDAERFCLFPYPGELRGQRLSARTALWSRCRSTGRSGYSRWPSPRCRRSNMPHTGRRRSFCWCRRAWSRNRAGNAPCFR